MVPLVLFAASCFIGGEKIHIQKRQEATLTSLPTSDHFQLKDYEPKEQQTKRLMNGQTD